MELFSHMSLQYNPELYNPRSKIGKNPPVGALNCERCATHWIAGADFGSIAARLTTEMF